MPTIISRGTEGSEHAYWLIKIKVHVGETQARPAHGARARAGIQPCDMSSEWEISTDIFKRYFRKDETLWSIPEDGEGTVRSGRNKCERELYLAVHTFLV